MVEEIDKTRLFWNEMSAHGVDASVIDPHDTIGEKNAYIEFNRNYYIANELSHLANESLVLDYGCGTGNITRHISSLGYQCIGLDIAFDLLALNKSGNDLLCYDGECIPFDDNSFDAVVCYVVLNYLLDREYFESMLGEIHRVLKPGGKFIAIEQVNRTSRKIAEDNKLQRSVELFSESFEKCHFEVEATYQTRAGHFPFIYLVRAGFVPRRFFSFVVTLDRVYSSIFSFLPLDYFDTVFRLRKRVQP